MTPFQSGFIDGENGVRSLNDPSRVMVRNQGHERVYAAFFSFEVPNKLSTVKSATLYLHSVENKELVGDYTLYAQAGAEWDPGSLSAEYAPGWDVDKYDANLEECIEIGWQRPYNEVLAIPFDEAGNSFLKKNKGKRITLVLVKKGKHVSYLYTPTAGKDKAPYIEIKTR